MSYGNVTSRGSRRWISQAGRADTGWSSRLKRGPGYRARWLGPRRGAQSVRSVRVAQEVRGDWDVGDAGAPGGALDALPRVDGAHSPIASALRSAASSSQVPRENRTTRVLPALPVTLATPSMRLRQRKVTSSDTRSKAKLVQTGCGGEALGDRGHRHATPLPSRCRPRAAIHRVRQSRKTERPVHIESERASYTSS